MKNNYFFFIIIILLLNSCQEKTPYNTALNKYLKVEDSRVLNVLVDDFETNVLAKTYKNSTLEESYIEFLKSMKNGDNFPYLPTKEARLLFNKSNLKLEIYTVVDSVWVINDSIQELKESKLFLNDNLEPETVKLNSYYPFYKTRYKYNFLDSLRYDYGVHYRGGFEEGLTKDSIIKRLKNSISNNMVGKYHRFLYKSQDKNEFIKTFYNKKEAAGSMHPESKAAGYLFHNIDVSNLLMRQIIVLEFAY